MKLPLVLIFAFLLFSCSTKSIVSEKDSYIPTPSKKLIKQNIKITIPEGWKEISDNADPLFEIWLINDFNIASIVFIPITLSENNISSDGDDLEIISDLLLNKQKSNILNFDLVKKETYSVRKLKVAEVKYFAETIIHNMLIFTDGNSYYESLAYFSENYTPSSSEIQKLFETQKKILQTVSFQ